MKKNPRAWTEGSWSETGAIIPRDLPDFLFLHFVHDHGPGRKPFCITRALRGADVGLALSGAYFGEKLLAEREGRTQSLPRWFWRKIPSPINRPLT